MEMSDEMYLLPQITYHPLLFTHHSSLITHHCPFKFDVSVTDYRLLITDYGSVHEVAKWAGAFKDVKDE